MELWPPSTLFLVACLLSATTAIGSLVRTEGLTAAGVVHCIAFHGPIGGALGMISYEFLARAYSWKWPFAPLVAGIAYGGNVVKIPSFSVTDLRAIILKALGGPSPPGNHDDPQR